MSISERISLVEDVSGPAAKATAAVRALMGALRSLGMSSVGSGKVAADIAHIGDATQKAAARITSAKAVTTSAAKAEATAAKQAAREVAKEARDKDRAAAQAIKAAEKEAKAKERAAAQAAKAAEKQARTDAKALLAQDKAARAAERASKAGTKNSLGPVKGITGQMALPRMEVGGIGGIINSAAGNMIAGAAGMLANAAASLAAAVAGLAVSGAKMAVASSSFRESTIIGFQSFVGSEQAASDLYEKALDLADAVGADKEQAVAQLKSLMSSGLGQDQALGAVKAAADLAAVKGQGASDAFTALIEKVQASGKFDETILAKLTKQGIKLDDVYSSLAKTTGKSVDEVKKLVKAGDIDATAGIQAMIDGIEGGAIGGLGEKLGNTFDRLLGDVGGNFERLFDKVDISPLKDAMKGVIGALQGDAGAKLRASFEKLFGSIFKLAGGLDQGGIEAIISRIADAISMAGDVAAAVGPTIVRTVKDAIKAFDALATVLGGIGKAAQNMTGLAALDSLLGRLGSKTSATSVVMSSLGNVLMTALTGGLSDAFSGLAKLNDGFDFLGRKWSEFKGWASSPIDWSGIWTGITGALASAWEAITGWVSGLASSIGGAASSIGSSIVSGIVNGIVSGAGAVGSAIASLVGAGGGGTATTAVSGALPGHADGGVVTGIKGGIATVSAAAGEGLASIGIGERIVPANNNASGGGGTVIQVGDIHVTIEGGAPQSADEARNLGMIIGREIAARFREIRAAG